MKEVWNLNELVNKKPENILEEIKKDVESFIRYKSIIHKNNKDIIDTVFKIILLKEKMYEKLMLLNGYYSLRFYENTKDEEASAKISMLKQLGTEINNKTLFFSHWIMKLDEKTYKKIINSEKLKSFKHYFEKTRNLKKHTLSEDKEQIINLKNIASSGFFDIYEHITSSFTFDFEGKKITEEELKTKCRSPDPEVREKAYILLLSKYESHKSELTEIYRNIVLDWYNEDILIRKYKRPISSRNISNDLKDKTIDSLINVIKKNNHVFQEYFKVKHEIINNKLPKNKRYEFSRFHLYAPYVFKSKKYSYEFSKKYVLQKFKDFDKRFYDAANLIFKNKHIHSHPQKNKRSGAFCSLITNKHLPYIMLNHTDDIRDLFTMAHELGHGIHDVLSMNQPNLLQHAPLPLCETASIFSEMILADDILKKSDNIEEKKYVLMNLLDNQYASITRQAYFVIFEIYAHDNMHKGITIKDLDDMYLKLLKEQFGNMKIPEIFKNEWNYIPHIHEYPFYCYSYAFGNLMVLSLYEIYRREGKKFVDKYVNILSKGGSQNPEEMFLGIGIDITSEDFWQKGFEIIKEEVKKLKNMN
ncbi:MAG: M3 family oligoendopeptidase [Candidatus Woesearchaeota archaeon]